MSFWEFCIKGGLLLTSIHCLVQTHIQTDLLFNLIFGAVGGFTLGFYVLLTSRK